MSQDPNNISFDEWMSIGIQNKWCGPPVCYTHDGLPLAHVEEDIFNEGDDPCIHIVRMYESPEQAEAIVEAHSPSQWRNHYTALPKNSQTSAE